MAPSIGVTYSYQISSNTSAILIQWNLQPTIFNPLSCCQNLCHQIKTITPWLQGSNIMLSSATISMHVSWSCCHCNELGWDCYLYNSKVVFNQINFTSFRWELEQVYIFIDTSFFMSHNHTNVNTSQYVWNSAKNHSHDHLLILRTVLTTTQGDSSIFTLRKIYI